METLSESEIDPSVAPDEKSPKGKVTIQLDISNHAFAYLLHFFEILMYGH